jgi:hypothetical protein
MANSLFINLCEFRGRFEKVLRHTGEQIYQGKRTAEQRLENPY